MATISRSESTASQDVGTQLPAASRTPELTHELELPPLSKQSDEESETCCVHVSVERGIVKHRRGGLRVSKRGTGFVLVTSAHSSHLPGPNEPLSFLLLALRAPEEQVQGNHIFPHILERFLAESTEFLVTLCLPPRSIPSS